MNQTSTKVIRILVGVMMIVFGLNKFLQFMPMEPPTGQMGELMSVLASSPFLAIIGILEVVGGLGLVLNKYVPLSLIIIIAIMINAALFHLFFDPANVVGSLVFLVLSLVLVYAYKDRFNSILSA